jgi:hypothetical protein
VSTVDSSTAERGGSVAEPLNKLATTVGRKLNLQLGRIAKAAAVWLHKPPAVARVEEAVMLLEDLSFPFQQDQR